MSQHKQILLVKNSISSSSFPRAKVRQKDSSSQIHSLPTKGRTEMASAAGRPAASREDVKVVLIDTQYVVADPLSFKSVVQSLTGKDSCVSWIEENSFSGAKRKRPVDDTVGRGTQGKEVVAANEGGGDWRRLTKGMSFKDLDRMMLDLPPAEELNKLWAQYNLV